MNSQNNIQNNTNSRNNNNLNNSNNNLKKNTNNADNNTITDNRRNNSKKEDVKNFQHPDLTDPNSLGRVHMLTPLDPTRFTTDPNGTFEHYLNVKTPINTLKIIKEERFVLCNNYAPLPVVLAQGDGIYLKDVENRIYIDFLSGYSAVNFGHNNQYIINGVVQQMNSLYMTSRGFYNNMLYNAANIVSKVFNYEKVLFMNSGVEAGESAVKIARKWAYTVKGIQQDKAKIVFAKNNFWGRTIFACGTSDDPSRYTNFGPYEKSHYLVDYSDSDELEALLNKDSDICAVFIEPIQGEGGVNIPDKGYLTKVSELCKKHNILFICDEIQTGLGRTGYRMYCDSENVRPDIVLLGKSLSGGIYPVSAVLSSSKIMNVIKPGEHGSTYGGNPLASAAVVYAMTYYLRNNLNNNAQLRGLELGTLLQDLRGNKLVKEIRGRGLLFAIELFEDAKYDAYDFSLWLMERGILCKPTRKNVLR